MAYVYYNLTNLTNAGNQTTILTFVKGVNDVMNYVPTVLILVAIGIVLFLILLSKGSGVPESFAASLWVLFILSLILYAMDLIPGKILIMFGILLPISIFVLWVWGDKQFG